MATNNSKAIRMDADAFNEFLSLFFPHGPAHRGAEVVGADANHQVAQMPIRRQQSLLSVSYGGQRAVLAAIDAYMAAPSHVWPKEILGTTPLNYQFLRPC